MIDEKIKGILAFYIDVGTQNRTKAKETTNHYKEILKENNFLERLKSQGVEVLFIPVRPDSETNLDMIYMPESEESWT